MGYRPTQRAKKGCNRCGSRSVAWHKGAKWYLVEVFTVNGEDVASHTDFHSTYCGEPDVHDARQRELDSDRKREDREEFELRKRAEERANVESAEKVLAWYRMPVAEIPARIEQLERQGEAFQRNPPTMDYMVEYGQEIAAEKMRKVELQVLTARLNNEKAVV